MFQYNRLDLVTSRMLTNVGKCIQTAVNLKHLAVCIIDWWGALVTSLPTTIAQVKWNQAFWRVRHVMISSLGVKVKRLAISCWSSTVTEAKVGAFALWISTQNIIKIDPFAKKQNTSSVVQYCFALFFPFSFIFFYLYFLKVPHRALHFPHVFYE